MFDTLSDTGGNYESAISSLDSYLKPKKNLNYERYIFLSARQNSAETVDAYITHLRLLTISCDYGGFEEEMIRDHRNYKKQRNIVVNLNKEAKLQYFNNYDSTNTKPFWENCKPYFSNKHNKADTDIILSENGDLILKNDKIANPFHDYLRSIVENMNLYEKDKPFSISKDYDVIKNITQKYKNHPSITSLKRNCKGISYFSLQ